MVETVGCGVIGNTEDSDSFVLGSSPGTPAKYLSDVTLLAKLSFSKYRQFPCYRLARGSFSPGWSLVGGTFSALSNCVQPCRNLADFWQFLHNSAGNFYIIRLADTDLK
jgi:hypothetical protein